METDRRPSTDKKTNTRKDLSKIFIIKLEETREQKDFKLNENDLNDDLMAMNNDSVCAKTVAEVNVVDQVEIVEKNVVRRNRSTSLVRNYWRRCKDRWQQRDTTSRRMTGCCRKKIPEVITSCDAISVISSNANAKNKELSNQNDDNHQQMADNFNEFDRIKGELQTLDQHSLNVDPDCRIYSSLVCTI